MTLIPYAKKSFFSELAHHSFPQTFLSIIGENGANLKMLMESMHLRDRKSFVNNYINPNLSEGYIAMLYPEIPNYPMQSYYLTKKGRELLDQL